MTLPPRDQPDRDRRTSLDRRGGPERRVGDRRLGTEPAASERRGGVERRRLVERRQRTGRRRTDREGGPLVVLFVGEDARPVRELLDTSAPDAEFALEAVDQRSAALARLDRGDVDVVLLDSALPRGLQTFADPSATKPMPPVLVLSRSDDERRALEAVRAGAQDYLVEGRFDGPRLARALRYAVERHRLRSALRDLLLSDELTGLYNRRGFVTLATQDLRLARRARQELLVAFADVDDLKQVNDTLGHAEGDQALRDVAGILRRTFRDSDLIARIGGDEFAVLVRAAEPDSVEVLRKRLNDQLHAFGRRAKRGHRISIGLGFAQSPAISSTSVESLLRRADAALYREKRRRDTEGGRAQAPHPAGVAGLPYAVRPIDILLVEDEPTDIELAKLALRRAKVQNRLWVVSDGEEALAFLRREPPYATVSPPDVVLLDLNLPGKSGRQVLRAMREDRELRDIPVVILTASNGEHTELAPLHPDAFLTKPVDFDRLAHAVGSVASLGFTIVKLPA